MAGQTVVTKALIKAAAKGYCERIPGNSISEDEYGKIRIMENGVPRDKDVILWEEEGKLKTNNTDFGMVFMEYIRDEMVKNLQEKPSPAQNLVTKEQREQIDEIKRQKTEPMPQTKPDSTILSRLLNLFDADVLEVYGDTGVGKTIFCQELAEQAARSGAVVIYVDTEKNVSRKAKARLQTLPGYKEVKADSLKTIRGPGFYYIYTPVLAEISSITQNLPDANLVVIDSLGMPVLVKYSRMNQNQQGHALQEMIAIKGDLKEWSYRCGGLAVDVNQPVSEMNKQKSEISSGLPPFGDKSGFATKSVLRFKKVSETEGKTIISGEVYKARDIGKGTKILQVTITNQGGEVQFCKGASA